MSNPTTWPRLNLAAGPVQVTEQTLRDAARPILYHYDPAGSGGRGQLIQGPQQFQFRQGTNGVITGFEQGTHGMLVGGIRRLTIPPSLAYGAAGNPNAGIVANEWIVFDVQLVAVAD